MTVSASQMAQVVYTNVTGDVGAVGTLFQGKKIWFAQRVPQRQRFVQLVQVSHANSSWAGGPAGSY